VIQPVLLLTAELWLLWRAPRYLWNYIAAQAGVTFCLFATLIFYSESTPEYARVWGLCTALLTVTYIGLARFFLSKHPVKSLAIGSAFLLCAFCVTLTYSHLAKPLRFYEWLAIAAGGILVSCGTILGISAPYHFGRDRVVALVLGLLFIAQSLWQVGFVLHLPNELWERANYVVPTLFCVAGWGYLGLTLRRQQQPVQRHD